MATPTLLILAAGLGIGQTGQPEAPPTLLDNQPSGQEIREEAEASLSDVPLVLQYNKSDLTDPFALETLHRRLDVPGAAAFEAVAPETTGVLQTLSTLSKYVIRTLREQQFEVTAEPPIEPSAPEQPIVPDPAEALAEVPSADSPSEETFEGPIPADLVSPQPDEADAPEAEWPGEASAGVGEPVSATERMENAIAGEADHPEVDAIDHLAGEAQTMLDAPWEEANADAAPSVGVRIGPELTIASVGEASRSGERGVRVPVVLSDKDGRTATVVLTIQIDPVLDGDRD